MLQYFGTPLNPLPLSLVIYQESIYLTWSTIFPSTKCLWKKIKCLFSWWYRKGKLSWLPLMILPPSPCCNMCIYIILAHRSSFQTHFPKYVSHVESLHFFSSDIFRFDFIVTWRHWHSFGVLCHWKLFLKLQPVVTP